MTLYDAGSDSQDGSDDSSKDGSVDSSDNDESVDDEDESAYKSESTESTTSTTMPTTTTTTTATTSTTTKELSLDEGTTQLLTITTEFVMPTLGDNGEWSSDSQGSYFSTEKAPETQAEDVTDVPKIPATWSDWVSETRKKSLA